MHDQSFYRKEGLNRTLQDVFTSNEMWTQSDNPQSSV